MDLETAIELHRRVARQVLDIALKVTVADLARPTPCSEWTVGDLLGHMTAMNRGFAAAARGETGDASAWTTSPTAPERTVRAYTDSATVIEREFGQLLERPQPMVVAPAHPTQAFPPATAVSIHVVELVAHGWDLARALGVAYTGDAPAIALAFTMVRDIPDDETRRKAGAPFGPAIPVGETVDDLTRFLGIVGRSADWVA
ncbi:TIGR03086 family protein [Planosporangium thailandense]|uniref:TIGR03086 family protein n=1 Tax=Planosporangium thailandense TaxID=765197 RepID=A0ABX0Y2C8_9ACTN|nr:TIGR03086 family metal-binding protein [Planosporangium thailandense]NJC71592.1 TIGR03086 family protein [Planosporangium thailandense]